MNRKLFLGAVLILFLITSAISQYSEYINSDRTLEAIFDSLNVNISQISIVIDKSDYKLSIVNISDTVKQYPVVFGGNPINDKLMEGDNCTPEGTFTMIQKYPHKSWSKFIWINYPTDESWQKHRKAKKDGDIPDNATIGGEIGIHGVPEGYDDAIDSQSNWTLGCISLKNKDVNEIYDFITEDIEIIIRK